jgi:hypothetical protein
MFPTLRAIDGAQYARKEQIPIEAIYAYIECKHTLVLDAPEDKSGLLRASQQVERFKALCAERDKTILAQYDPYILLTSQEKAKGAPWLPQYRNPPFGMIFARQVADKNKSAVLKDTKRIHEILKAGRVIKKSATPVDVVIAGSDNVMAPGYLDEDGEIQNCLFMLPEKQYGLGCFMVPDLAFGVGIVHLLAVLDWLRLHRLPWERVLSEAQNSEKGQRT